MYCNNNPVMYVDPSGHLALTTIIILTLIAVGVVAGGTTAGVISYNKGYRGWELAEHIFAGAVIGGLIGAAIGCFAAPTIAGLLTSVGTIGGGLVFAGGLGSLGGGIAISAIGKLALIGTIATVGSLSRVVVMAVQWEPGSWPGDDPTISPGDDFEWVGKLPVGGDKGAWYNPVTGDSLHPDLNHPAPIGPHWDWVNKALKIFKRIFRGSYGIQKN